MSEIQEPLTRGTSHIRRDRTGSISLPVPIIIESLIHLEPGYEIEWQVEGDRLILTPRPPQKLSIHDLIAQITPENKHDYIETGAPVGNEVW